MANVKKSCKIQVGVRNGSDGRSVTKISINDDNSREFVLPHMHPNFTRNWQKKLTGIVAIKFFRH